MGLIDSTLREGGQTVGVCFSLADKLAIVSGLHRVGIEEVEIGIASPRHGDLHELVGAIRMAHGRAVRIAVWSRCLSADIAAAVELGIDVLSLSVPVSNAMLAAKLRMGRDAVLALVEQAVRQAKSRVAYVSLGFEDATRADRGFLEQVAGQAVAAGADRLRLADTVGICTPAELSALVRRVKEISGVAVGVHTHNDFGMATANAIAALESGADWADVTLLGLGERAGNARLEEVAAYLALRRQVAYDVAMLPELCAQVANMAGRAIPAQQPVVGSDIFACETGLHVQGLLHDPATYEPFAPEAVGKTRRLYFGGKTGVRAVESALRSAGLSLPGHGLEKVVQRLRQEAQNDGRLLAAEELPRFAGQLAR